MSFGKKGLQKKKCDKVSTEEEGSNELTEKGLRERRKKVLEDAGESATGRS